MANVNLKEQLQKKTLFEVETMIIDQKGFISAEKDFTKLHRLNVDLVIMQEVRDQKQRESGRTIRKNPGPAAKPVLKSFDDYVKSKK